MPDADLNVFGQDVLQSSMHGQRACSTAVCQQVARWHVRMPESAHKWRTYLELLAVDALTARAIAAGEVTALRHSGRMCGQRALLARQVCRMLSSTNDSFPPTPYTISVTATWPQVRASGRVWADAVDGSYSSGPVHAKIAYTDMQTYLHPAPGS
jgi:hypothetical protein